MVALSQARFRKNPWIDFAPVLATQQNEVGQLQLAATVSIEARLVAVEHYLSIAATGDPKNLDPVHDLRVCTRRAIAALSLYHELLPNGSSKQMRKTMKSIRQAAGDARDLDVLIQRLKTSRFKGKKQLIKLLRKRRTWAQQPLLQLQHRLTQKNRLRRRRDELLHQVSAADSVPLVDWASDRLWSVFGDVESASLRVQVDQTHLHSFRIALKKLRYRIELLADLFDQDLRIEIYPQVCAMQDRLGDINDHFAAAQQFRSLRKWCSAESNRKLLRRLKSWQRKERQLGRELAQEFVRSYDSNWMIGIRRSLAGKLSPPREPGSGH